MSFPPFLLKLLHFHILVCYRCAVARAHISSVQVAAQVWCIVVQAKHSLSTKEATALTEALAIHYSLTVAANDPILNRKAKKAIGQFLKNEELLKGVCQVSLHSQSFVVEKKQENALQYYVLYYSLFNILGKEIKLKK